MVSQVFVQIAQNTSCELERPMTRCGMKQESEMDWTRVACLLLLIALILVDAWINGNDYER
jgi:hypothetical protein